MALSSVPSSAPSSAAHSTPRSNEGMGIRSWAARLAFLALAGTAPVAAGCDNSTTNVVNNYGTKPNEGTGGSSVACDGFADITMKSETGLPISGVEGFECKDLGKGTVPVVCPAGETCEATIEGIAKITSPSPFYVGAWIPGTGIDYTQYDDGVHDYGFECPVAKGGNKIEFISLPVEPNSQGLWQMNDPQNNDPNSTGVYRVGPCN